MNKNGQEIVRHRVKTSPGFYCSGFIHPTNKQKKLGKQEKPELIITSRNKDQQVLGLGIRMVKT